MPSQLFARDTVTVHCQPDPVHMYVTLRTEIKEVQIVTVLCTGHHLTHFRPGASLINGPTQTLYSTVSKQARCLTSTETIRLIRAGGKGGKSIGRQKYLYCSMAMSFFPLPSSLLAQRLFMSLMTEKKQCLSFVSQRRVEIVLYGGGGKG